MHPEFFGNELEQALLDFERILARRDIRTVGHPEDMSVDRDRRFPERDVQHDVRGLAADAGQLLERFAGSRNLATVLEEQHAARLDDVLRFHAKKPDGLDVLLETAHAEREDFRRRVRFPEELARRDVYTLVRRLGGEDHRHEELEWRPVLELG